MILPHRLMCQGHSPKFYRGKLLPRGRGVVLSGPAFRVAGNTLAPAPYVLIRIHGLHHGLHVSGAYERDRTCASGALLHTKGNCPPSASERLRITKTLGHNTKTLGHNTTQCSWRVVGIARTFAWIRQTLLSKDRFDILMYCYCQVQCVLPRP